METIKPKQVIIEVTSRCNLQCKFCPNLTDDTAGDMEYEKVIEVLDKIDDPENTTVIPWMNGEPLLHPRYADILQAIVDRNIRCYVTTNGMIWNDDVARILTNNNSIYQLIVSLDGLHTLYGSKSIEVGRPGTDRNKVIANLSRYIDLVRPYGNEKLTTDIAVKICDRGQDWEEIEEYVKYWLDHVDFVVVGKRLGNENEESMRMFPCQYFDNNFIVIRHDGKLVPCAYHHEMVNNNGFPLGNIFDYKTITEAYNNERYTMLRKLHKTGDFPEHCDTCGFAYTGHGFKGIVQIPGIDREVYYHQDYYNMFFSYQKKWKSNEYYGHKGGK